MTRWKVVLKIGKAIGKIQAPNIVEALKRAKQIHGTNLKTVLYDKPTRWEDT